MPDEADDGARRAADDSGERLAVLEQLESWLERPSETP